MKFYTPMQFGPLDTSDHYNFENLKIQDSGRHHFEQEGQHPLTGQRAAHFRLLANQ